MRRLIGAGVALALCASAASADIIIGNLGDTSGGGTLFGDGASTVFKAAGFTMPDAGPNYFLDSVILTIAAANNGAMPDMQLWEGDNEPLNLVADIPDFVFGDVVGPEDFEWTPNGQIVLEAGKTYWVYMDNSAGGPDWLWDSGATTPMGIAESAGYIFNGNPSSFQNTYQVNGTEVPAPAGFAALLGAIALRRRRRRM